MAVSAAVMAATAIFRMISQILVFFIGILFHHSRSVEGGGILVK